MMQTEALLSEKQSHILGEENIKKESKTGRSDITGELGARMNTPTLLQRIHTCINQGA